eukprot:GHVU01166700.1.p1 GENE.GHVU01166700.1~~GHVU01166700.1.p1  ORF type:complete len:217 (+),score=18.68 GHVU01166700.1:237-887(+)
MVAGVMVEEIVEYPSGSSSVVRNEGNRGQRGPRPHPRSPFSETDGQYVCNYCFALFPTEARINTHFQSHQIPCKFCEDILMNPKKFKEHMKRHHGDRCPYCFLESEDPLYIERHIRADHSFGCEICFRLYDSAEELVAHSTMAHKFACYECQLDFKSCRLLRRHTLSKHRVESESAESDYQQALQEEPEGEERYQPYGSAPTKSPNLARFHNSKIF